MMRLFGLTAIASLWAGAAAALSCLPVSVEALYTRAADANEAYIPVVGTLSQVFVTPKPRRDPDFSAGEQGTAEFSGYYIGNEGKLVPWYAEIFAETHCVASWCGAVPEGQEFLGFLRVDNGAYIFDGHACPQVISPASHEEVVRMQDCLAGADCTPDF